MDGLAKPILYEDHLVTIRLGMLRIKPLQFVEMSPTSPSLLTLSSSQRRGLQGVHPRSGCGSIRGLRLELGEFKACL